MTNVFVVGIGLIGGSMVLDIKSLHPEATIYGIDNNESHLAEAIALGVVDSGATFEDLIDAIPSNVCSRSHKVNCINDLCERGIFERKENPEDKRSTIIVPSKKTNDQYLKIFNFYKSTIKLFDFDT